jgi:hypothetical protein
MWYDRPLPARRTRAVRGRLARRLPLLLLLPMRSGLVRARPPVVRVAHHGQYAHLSGAAADEHEVCPALRRALRAAGVDDEEDCRAADVADLRALPHDDQDDTPWGAVWTRPRTRTTTVGTRPPAPPRGDDGRGDDGPVGVYLWDDHLREGSWQSHVDDELARADESYSLEGSLSASGGMHRTLHQRLHLAPTSVPANNQSRGVVEVLVVLPPALFLNVEEAVQVLAPGNVQVRRVWSPAVIDQEEPAFVSPSHAVLLELDFFLETTGDDAMTTTTRTTVVEWNLLLHVRYPSPLPQGADFGLVAVLSPVVWSLHVGGVALTSPRPWHTTIMGNKEPLYLWVAAGRREHLGITVAVTVAAALVGALVMLRAIVQTAARTASG